jgi:hypothetical protein
MSYAREKLATAIYKLTVGEEDIKGRLEAITSEMAAVSEGDFPEPLRPLWASIIERLTSKTSAVQGTKYDEGAIAATLHRMQRRTASQIAKDIVELEDRLQAALADGLWR